MLLIVVGGVLLLNNLGVLPWSVWASLGQLWPVILILFGLDLLLGRRSAWVGGAVAVVLVLAVVGAAIWLTVAGRLTPASPTEEGTTTVPLAGATSGEVTLRFGAGNLTVGALAPPGTNLVEAKANLPPGLRLTSNVSTVGETAHVVLSTEGSTPPGAFFGPNFGPPRRDEGIRLTALLAPRIPLSLQADVGAGQADLDLTDLVVHDLTVNSGAGQTTIHFPTSAGQTTAEIHSGAGQVELIIPPTVGAAIHTSGGVVNLHLPSDRFQKVADGYQTPNYQTAPNRVDVTLHVGLGWVDVR